MGRYSVLLLAVASFVFATPAAAQYFGRNKVQYRHLAFRLVATEHFDIHYYEDEEEAAVDAARMAERAYARLSRVLNHQYRERQPIILFASHSEFQQNNVTEIGEATGGVTDAFRHRVMLPFTGSYAEFEHVLTHELVHQFQYDVFARGRIVFDVKDPEHPSTFAPVAAGPRKAGDGTAGASPAIMKSG